MMLRTPTRPGDPVSRAQDSLVEAIATHGHDLLLVTTGTAAGVLAADLLWSIAPTLEVACLDTGLGFPTCRRAIDDLATSVGGRLTVLRPAISLADQDPHHGPDLWSRAPETCCWLRQVSVLRQALAGRSAWVTAATGGPADRPAFGLPRVDPLWGWTEDQVAAALQDRRLPAATRSLPEPSGACSPCTRFRREPTGQWRTEVAPGRLVLP